MTPFYTDPLVTLYLGDCLEVMPSLPAESVDAVVTDPPYGLGFMGKHWDHGVPNVDFWREMFRLAKPSAYLLAFGGTRTVHRIATNIEDAGWIIRDQLDWIYASGFPKGRANLKPAHEPIVMARKPGRLRPLAIDECRIPGQPHTGGAHAVTIYGSDGNYEPGPNVEGNEKGRWPSNVLLSDPELFDVANPWVVGSGASATTGGDVRTPNQHAWMVGDGPEFTSYGDSGGYSRFFLIPQRYNGTCARCGLAISADATSYQLSPSADSAPSDAAISPGGTPASTAPASTATTGGGTITAEPESRFWSDVGESTPSTPRSKRRGTSPASTPPSSPAKSPDAASPATGTTTTTPSRSMCATCAEAITSPTISELPPNYPKAFLIPKADRAERERGLGNAPAREAKHAYGDGLNSATKIRTAEQAASGVERAPRANVHPTVKPIDLMRHLVRLVTPPGGVCLDPFLGSGTTALAASEEGFRCIGIEREAEYLDIAKGRLMATPMGLGLDVPAATKRPPKTHPDLSKHQPKQRAPADNYSGGWVGTDEDAA